MSFICSVIAIELATKGGVGVAIIVFMVGIMIDVLIIDALETSLSTEGSEK